MKNIDELKGGERAPIHLLVSDESRRAYAIPYNLITGAAVAPREVVLHYANRKLTLRGRNLTTVGAWVLDHRVRAIAATPAQPGDDDTETMVMAAAPEGGPGPKVELRTFDVEDAKHFDRAPLAGKDTHCFVLASTSKQALAGVTYHFVSHMDYVPGRIGIEYPQGRIELLGLNLDDLWLALVEHRLATVEVVERTGTLGIQTPKPSDARLFKPKPAGIRL